MAAMRIAWRRSFETVCAGRLPARILAGVSGEAPALRSLKIGIEVR
jgi:hypothetical protein